MTDCEYSDILTTAIEGGSNYWFSDHRVEAFYCEQMKRVMIRCVIVDKMLIDKKRVESAVESLMKRVDCKNARMDWSSEGSACDAETADIIFQLAVFGDVIYG